MSRTSVFARLAFPALALCLAMLAAAPVGAQQAGADAGVTDVQGVQQHADALSRALAGRSGTGSAPAAAGGSLLQMMVDKQHLPTQLVGRIPIKFQRAAASERDRNDVKPTSDSVLTYSPEPGKGVRLGVRPHATSSTITVTSQVQTQDITSGNYPVSSSGALATLTPNNVDPFFSPSEKYIYYASDRTNSSTSAPSTAGTYHIYAVSPSGGTTNPIAITGPEAGQPTVSAAGEKFLGERFPSVLNDTQIAYCELVASANGDVHFDLYVATIGAGGPATQITGVTRLPDGTTPELNGKALSVTHPSLTQNELAFAATTLDANEAPVAGNTSHIFVYSASTGLIQLTTGPADDENPAISPDGTGILAFDSNVGSGGYAGGGTATGGELTSSAPKATRDIWLAQYPFGNVVNQFTMTPTGGMPHNNIQPAWSQPFVNDYFNNDGAHTYLFFSSDRNDSVYDIYFLRADDRNVTVSGQLVEDLELQDNSAVPIGANLAARVLTSSPKHKTDDALATPINNLEPTISRLKNYLSVTYVSDRYLVNNVSDNPLAPNLLSLVGTTGYPSLPATAQDNEPTNLTTDPHVPGLQGNYEVLSSQLIDINPPTLLFYDNSAPEVIHVEDQTSQKGQATRQLGPGHVAQFIVRLSDRQTGVGRVFLQIKDPNGKYQQVSSAPPLEHKVYTRWGGFDPYVMHDKENDESTTLFEVNNFDFDLTDSLTAGSFGYPVLSASIAGAKGGGNGSPIIETGGLLVYPRQYPQVNTTVVSATTNTMGNPTSIIVKATPTIDDFSAAHDLFPGDELVISCPLGTPSPHSPIKVPLTNIVNNGNGTYTFSLGAEITLNAAAFPPTVQPQPKDTVIVENSSVITATIDMGGGTSGYNQFKVPGAAMYPSQFVYQPGPFQLGDTISMSVPPTAAIPNPPAVEMILDSISKNSDGSYEFGVTLPNGQNVPSAYGLGEIVQTVARFDPQGQEVDCEAIDGATDYTGVTPGVDNFTVPIFTPGIDDATALNGVATLTETPDVDPETGPINRATGNGVWLELEPFIPSATLTSVADATHLFVSNTSGIVGGDTITIGTEQVVVSTTTVVGGVPEIVLLAPGVQKTHAPNEPVALVTSPSGGVLYAATWVTPSTPSDFFIDAIAFDNAAYPLTNGDGVTTPLYDAASDYLLGQVNWRIYDNVWGFSTMPFSPATGPSVLVVSDYALPQKFFKGRFGAVGVNNSQAANNNLPFTYFGAESYLTDIEVDNGDPVYEDGPALNGINAFLSGTVSDSNGNYGGVSHAVTPSFALAVTINSAMRGFIDSVGTFNDYSRRGIMGGTIGYQNGLGVNSYIDGDQSSVAIADATSDALLPSSQQYDIWRILARGPIPASVLSDYAPNAVSQFDASDSGTHQVQVANNVVIWVSPFSGNQFSTYGTIVDTATAQPAIEAFIDAGGRFFVEGQDIGYALTGNQPGNTSSAFYTKYLNATYVNDISTFTSAAYVLTPGTGSKNVISNEGFRNATGVRQHRGFTVENIGGILNYDPPSSSSSVAGSYQAPTVSHTPFTGDNPQFPYYDASTRSDGSMDDGYGDVTTVMNASTLGNIDATMPANTAAPGIVYEGAAADLSGNATDMAGKFVPDQMLYYFGTAKLGLTDSGAVAAGATTITVAVAAGTAANVVQEVAANDQFILDTGANAETVTVLSAAVSAADTTGSTVVLTLAKPVTLKHATGAALTRSFSNVFTNFVGYSSFGLEALSQEVFYNAGFTSNTSDANRFTSANRRTNILHNLICTTRTGTIQGTVTATNSPTANPDGTQPGVFVEASIVDAVTGQTITYTALTGSDGSYQMQGVLPGLYSFGLGSAFTIAHPITTTYVHGGDTLTQQIQVNPSLPGAVTVTVTDKLTGKPVGGVTVILQEIHGAPGASGVTASMTDVNTGAQIGVVTFNNLAPSIYTVEYVKAGYDTSTDATGPMQTPPGPGKGTNITVTESATLAVNTVLSPAPATVFGLVSAASGPESPNALTGATIVFTDPNKKTYTVTSGTAFPGSDGTTANYTVALPATPSGIVYTYAASFTDAAGAYITITGTVTLTSGEAFRLDFPLNLAGIIKLVVINTATGLPVVGAVTATVVPATGSTGTTTTVSTTALAAVLPDTTPGYVVTLPAAEGNATQTQAVGAGQTVTFTFSVTPAPGSVTGTITDQVTKAPIAGAVVTLTNPKGVTLTSAPTGADGVYNIPGVPSGITYTATAAATGYTTASATGLTVAPSTPLTQNFALSSIYGSVGGTVTDSVTKAPIAGATVTATGGGKTYTGTTGAAGTYTIPNVLVAGSPYTATASATGFTSVTKTGVIVTPGTATPENFALASIYGSVTGTITDSVTKNPIAGITVTVTGGGKTFTGTTGTDGTYTISNVPVAASPYSVTAGSANYTAQTVTGVVVTPDTATPVSFVLVNVVIHHFGPGLQMFSVPSDYTGKALAAILRGEVSPTGTPVNLVAAWVTLNTKYALTPTPPAETLHIGQGYFARFSSSGGDLINPGTPATAATTGVPLFTGWNMIGNPYNVSTPLTSLFVQDSAGNAQISFTMATSAAVNFVSPQLYSYDQATNTYTLVEVGNPFGGSAAPTLDPYVGYWIYANTNCTLIFPN